MAAAACEVRLQRSEEFLRFVGLLCKDIRDLTGIGAEVVELELVIGAFALGDFVNERGLL